MTAPIDLVTRYRTLESDASAFAEARPYRHIVIDNFLDEHVARHAARNFPSFEAMHIQFAGLVEKRAIERRMDAVDPVFGEIFDTLRSRPFVSYVEALTGISQLEPDSTWTTGGIHQSRNGSYHNVHADQNRHGITGLFQRVNLLLYLNEEWDPSWGGALELWDDQMTRCVEAVQPVFNRLVIIEIHDRAYHGYPALRMPPEVTRKSLAIWYFSEVAGQLQAPERHEVLFQLRPGDSFAVRVKHHVRKLKPLIKTLTKR